LPGLSVAAGAAVVCLTGVLVCARAEDDMALVCVRAGRFPSLDDSKNGIRRVRVRGVECSDNGDNQLSDDWCRGREWVASWVERMRQSRRKENRGSCLNMVSKVAGRSLGCARLCAVVRWAMGLPSVACGCLGCEQNRSQHCQFSPGDGSYAYTQYVSTKALFDQGRGSTLWGRTQ
jgi:hypothetical protein